MFFPFHAEWQEKRALYYPTSLITPNLTPDNNGSELQLPNLSTRCGACQQISGQSGDISYQYGAVSGFDLGAGTQPISEFRRGKRLSHGLFLQVQDHRALDSGEEIHLV